MKIETIEVFQIDLPYSGGVYHLSAGRTYESFDATLVKLTTDDGHVGWGESTPFGATYVAAHGRGVRAGIEELAPVLLGRDPRQVDRINDLMDDTLLGHNHAKAPLDVACWDVFGKSVGLPVAELLGGSTGVPMPTISSIHAGDPAEMRARVADHRARGYLGHSVKIGALDAESGPALDAQRIVESLADRRAGEYFLVDANAGTTAEHILRMLALLPDGLDFVLESPAATFRETASLRRRCDRPIILDELVQTEADLATLIAEDLADGIGLKVTPAGGLTKGRRQRDLCRAAGMTLSVQDTVGSTVAYAAIVHLAATVPPSLLRCILNSEEMVTVRTARFDHGGDASGVLVSDAPGLGIEVDEALLGVPVAVYA